MAEFHLVLEPTEKIISGPDGFMGRVWKGKTPNGVPVECLITQVRSKSAHEQKELDDALIHLGKRVVPLELGDWKDPIAVRMVF